MSDQIRVVVDAMGGDEAPQVPIQGAIEAMQENENIVITLVGQESAINTELEKYQYDTNRLHIVHADEVIGFDEPPVMAVRKKKNSSRSCGKGKGVCVQPYL